MGIAGAAAGGKWAGSGDNFKNVMEMSPGPQSTFLNGQDQADAAQRMAQAQQDAAGRYQSFTTGQLGTALSKFDEMTPQQLAASQEAIHGQEANIQKQESLVSSIDPMLMEAGKQATQLLQGKAAPVLNQMKAQRADQRTQLLDNLRSQLGPGAETSTAGQQALQKFDMETSTQLNGAQQSYLGQMSGMLNQGLQTRPNMAGQYGALDTLGQSLTRPALERAGISQSFMPAVGSSFGQSIQSAGAPYMQQLLMAQNRQQVAGSVGKIGGSILGGAFGGPGGAAAGGSAGGSMSPSLNSAGGQQTVAGGQGEGMYGNNTMGSMFA